MIIESSNIQMVSALMQQYDCVSIPDSVYLYIYPFSKNHIIDLITNNAGDTCYPDICCKHDLTCISITDDILYTNALKQQKRYGTGNCYFITSDGIFDSFNIMFKALSKIFVKQNAVLLPDRNKVFQICNDLSLSETMSISFTQLLRYYASTGNNYELFIKNLYSEFDLPVTKNEGKKIYELIRKRIL